MATRVFGNFRALMAAAKSASTSSAAVGSKEPKGILKVVPVSPQLSEFVGASEVSRTEAVKKVWLYIKLHNLQNPANKREIQCDAKLKTIFNGKDTVGFLEIAKLLNQHFLKSA